MTAYNVLTLFPAMFASVCESSIWARAISAGLISVSTTDVRDYAMDKHRRADDYPLGGGAGMVMKPEPVDACFRDIMARSESPSVNVYMSPAGKPLTHGLVMQLASFKTVNILCGHYEGVDARALARHIDLEVSIGDYVLTGGELAAMVLIDAVIRHVGGVLGNDESAAGESFANGLLEYPQYTRPAEWEGQAAPEVLLSGHHAHVTAYRRQESLRETARRRPDLLSQARLTKKDIEFITRRDDADAQK
jgi:tRNA (guanine37-N1)-methyltransferase